MSAGGIAYLLGALLIVGPIAVLMGGRWMASNKQNPGGKPLPRPGATGALRPRSGRISFEYLSPHTPPADHAGRCEAEPPEGTSGRGEQGRLIWPRMARNGGPVPYPTAYPGPFPIRSHRTMAEVTADARLADFESECG